MDKKKRHKGDGHRQRLRERFLNAGLEGFQDYEVIELLLTLGTPRKDCKTMAKAALLRFKTLQAVMEASSHELCQVDGIGPKNSFGLKLIKAVSDRYLEKKLINKSAVNNSKELFDYLYHSISTNPGSLFHRLTYFIVQTQMVTLDNTRTRHGPINSEKGELYIKSSDQFFIRQ